MLARKSHHSAVVWTRLTRLRQCQLLHLRLRCPIRRREHLGWQEIRVSLHSLLALRPWLTHALAEGTLTSTSVTPTSAPVTHTTAAARTTAPPLRSSTATLTTHMRTRTTRSSPSGTGSTTLASRVESLTSMSTTSASLAVIARSYRVQEHLYASLRGYENTGARDQRTI